MDAIRNYIQFGSNKTPLGNVMNMWISGTELKILKMVDDLYMYAGDKRKHYLQFVDSKNTSWADVIAHKQQLNIQTRVTGNHIYIWTSHASIGDQAVCVLCEHIRTPRYVLFCSRLKQHTACKASAVLHVLLTILHVCLPCIIAYSFWLKLDWSMPFLVT